MRDRLTKWLFGLALVGLLGIAIKIVAGYYFVEPTWPKNWGLFDGRYYFGPNAFFLDASLRNGEFPFWNPLGYSGMPFSADPQTSANYPPHLLRSLLTPPFNPYATALSIQIVSALHVLFGGLGAYLLARSYRLSMPARLTAAFAFMFGPYSIIYYTEFYVYALIGPWLPWLFLLTRYSLDAKEWPRRVLFASLTALAFGMSTLAGFPQITLYFGIALAAYVFLDIAFNRSRPIKTAFPRNAGWGLALLAVTAVMGALVAAALLFPAYQFSKHSARIVASGLDVVAAPQKIEFMHLLKCLVIYPGNTWVPQGCRAAGIASLMAVMLAIGHRRKTDVIVFILLYLLMTDLTIGPPFPFGTLLHAVDTMNLTVSPWRAGLCASFPFAMALAFGVDAAGRMPEWRPMRSVRFEFVVIVGIAMMALLIYWLNDRPLFHPTLFVWLFPLLALIAMAVLTWVRAPRRGPAFVGILIMAEIMTWSLEMLPRYVSARVSNRSTEGFGEAREIWQGNSRTAHVQPNWQMWTLDAATNGYNPLYVADTRQTLCGPQRERLYRGHLLDDEVLVDNIRGHLFAKRSIWLAREWVAGPLPAKDETFPPTTTVYLDKRPEHATFAPLEIDRETVPRRAVSENSARIDIADAKAIGAGIRSLNRTESGFTLPALNVENRHSALYMGYRALGPVDVTPVLRDEDGAELLLARVRAASTRGDEQFLEFPLPDCETATITVKWLSTLNRRIEFTQAYALLDMGDENDRIHILRRRANSIDIRVDDLPRPRFLVHIDSFYPGWRAYVDGERAPIYKANDAFKAIAIPAGSHHVRFVYRPWAVYLGIAVSLLASLTLLGAIGWAGLRMRRERKDARKSEALSRNEGPNDGDQDDGDHEEDQVQR